MKTLWKNGLLLAALLAAPLAGAQPDDPFAAPGLGKKLDVPPKDRLKISAVFDPAEVRRGGTATLKVTLDPHKGYHTYPTKQADAKAESFVTTIEFPDSKDLTPAKTWKEPKPKLMDEKDLGAKVGIYEEKAVLENKMTVAKTAAPGAKTIKVKVSTQVCDEKGCIPVNETLDVAVTISAQAAAAAEAAPSPEATTAPTPTAAAPPASTTADSSFASFILQGVLFGFISLLTPCVFPMIPITVSFFLKQAERENHRPLQMALVYSLTIVAVLTIGAVTLLGFFQKLALHWATNFVLGGLFLVFSLSLFGLYEIRLPSGLANFTAAREGQGGLLGTVFMALTFTIISFTCVAPFLGGFAGIAAQSRPFHELVLGGLAFSVTFAAPFFLLALFPSWLKSMPKSGAWMNSVKVVMGFLELAAGLKFLRAGELLAFGEAEFLTYDFVMGMYIAIAVLCGLYLLNVYRLPHDDAPSEPVGVVRLMFGFLFLSLALYLMPGLFKYNAVDKVRPTGAVFAWLDSFLLPDEPAVAGPSATAQGGKADNGENGSHLAWLPNLQNGLQVSLKHKQNSEPKQLVFIDFTGMG